MRNQIFRSFFPIFTWFGLGAILTVAALPDRAATPGSTPVQPAPTISGPRVQVQSPIHDFGTVKQGEIVRHEFKLLNTGDQSLEIADVKPACGCTTAGAWSRSIKPGESGTIPIQLETSRFSGPLTKTITVLSNDRQKPQKVLEVKADIWTPIQLSSPVAVFPALTNTDQVLTKSVTIRNHLETPVALTELQSDSLAFKPVLKEIAAGKEFELRITTVPPLTNGTHTGRISFKTSNPQLPALSVTAVAKVVSLAKGDEP